mmetsp:Transcript_13000/g.30558  ORF Transcript_13000/g.30558 Transcript_13000/m.30558 type:complete len:205 (+) Transcript_13000:475-1089(+)
MQNHAAFPPEDAREEPQRRIRLHELRVRVHPESLRRHVRHNEGGSLAVCRKPCLRGHGQRHRRHRHPPVSGREQLLQQPREDRRPRDGAEDGRVRGHTPGRYLSEHRLVRPTRRGHGRNDCPSGCLLLQLQLPVGCFRNGRAVVGRLQAPRQMSAGERRGGQGGGGPDVLEGGPPHFGSCGMCISKSSSGARGKPGNFRPIKAR